MLVEFDSELAFRVMRLRARDTVGSNGANVGTVTAKIAGVLVLEIPPNISTSETTLFSIGGDERGRLLLVESGMLDAGVGQQAFGVIKVRRQLFGEPNTVIANPSLVTQNSPEAHHTVAIDLPPNCDLYAEVSGLINGPADFSNGMLIELEQRDKSVHTPAP